MDKRLGNLLMAVALSAWSGAAAGNKPETEEAKPVPQTQSAEAEPASTGAVPTMVLDESASRWVVDRFAGNTSAGYQLFQGLAREVGGISSRACVAPAPDGTVFLSTAENQIAQVTPDGRLQLLAGGGSVVGDSPGWQAEVRVESLAYSPADKSIYFVHRSIPCLRRLFEKDGQWRVAMVAGSPEQTGSQDGETVAARFQEPRSLAITSKGTIYLLDGVEKIRKIEGGRVSTLVAFKKSEKVVDGALDQATMAITPMSGMICLGEDDDTLYVADHWHFAARKIDFKSGQVTTVVGLPRGGAHSKRYNESADGPAMTHASFNSGCAFVCWDSVHNALWAGGPDELRLRWVRDGWLRTVLGYSTNKNWDRDGAGIPGKDMSVGWAHVRAVDAQGRAYFIDGWSKTGVWRAYEKEEAGK